MKPILAYCSKGELKLRPEMSEDILKKFGHTIKTLEELKFSFACFIEKKDPLYKVTFSLVELKTTAPFVMSENFNVKENKEEFLLFLSMMKNIFVYPYEIEAILFEDKEITTKEFDNLTNLWKQQILN